MQFTAAQIAQLLQGSVEGDANATVSRLSKIEEGGPGSLSFLANPAYTQYVYTTTASVVIIGKDFALTAPVKTTLVRVADAQDRCFAERAAHDLHTERKTAGAESVAERE